ncbi:unnamed protein product [marine sediment metagenome]|uniref:Uncharacterized protein n=1 Tax=marine sediment metagenome TaxID=412755 RepID=X1ARP9_9ZZZZ
MSKIHYITDWEDWEKFCALEDIDPYENVDHGFDLGGGNTFDIEYIGDLPEKKPMINIKEVKHLFIK